MRGYLLRFIENVFDLRPLSSSSDLFALRPRLFGPKRTIPAPSYPRFLGLFRDFSGP